WLSARCVDLPFFHTRAVEVTDLLFDRAAILCFRVFHQNSAQVGKVVFIELAVNAPRGLICGNGIFLLPASARIAVEIPARIDGFIHRRRVETWGIGEDGFTGFRGLL